MHFAIELAGLGNKVYFVNPPTKNNQPGRAVLNTQIEFPNIKIIDTRIFRRSLFFRHKLFFIYELISARYIKTIKKIVGEKISEVWCFNPQVYVNLDKFNAEKSLLLLYDMYQGKHVFKAAESAQYIISVSQLILDQFKNTKAPKLLLQHGLGKFFADKADQKMAQQDFSKPGTGKIKIGYTGNLLIAGMDIDAVIKVINQHQDKEFHFWGPFDLGVHNNISSGVLHTENRLFIEFLKRQENVFLHGVKSQSELVKGISEMDAFLLMYLPGKGLSQASNSHKIMEYLSTGKVVVSNFISNYAGSDLIEMVEEENEDLGELFNRVTAGLSFYNSEVKQKQRIEFALDNTYSRQVDRIYKFVFK